MLRLTATAVAVLHPAFAAAIYPDDMGDLFKQETKCPIFKCPSGQVAVQKAAKKKSGWPFTYGCDASSFDMLSMMDAGSLGNMGKKGGSREKLWKCCVGRDVGQQICGMPKQEVEDAYQKCSAKKCGADKNCKMQASFGLMMGGGMGGGDKCKEYNDFQKASCECVGKLKADGKFEDALQSFYGVFAKDKLPKAGQDVIDWMNESVYKKFKKGQNKEIWHALFNKYSSNLLHKEKPKPNYGDDLYNKDLYNKDNMYKDNMYNDDILDEKLREGKYNDLDRDWKDKGAKKDKDSQKGKEKGFKKPDAKSQKSTPEPVDEGDISNFGQDDGDVVVEEL